MDKSKNISFGEQYGLELPSVVEVEVDGIQMGVLSDGTPYLTMRGLASVCGVVPSVIHALTDDWSQEKSKPRGRKIDQILSEQGYRKDHLYVKTTRNRSSGENAYPDAVCMAILEYYAFEAKPQNQTALYNYRVLARSSLRQFIYNRSGYDPSSLIPDAWKNYRDRIILNDQIPFGYFSIFREIADIVVHLIQNKFQFNSASVPDLSVGKIWGKYWCKNDLDNKYSCRKKHTHKYPETYPQGAATIDAWIYPVESLGEFRQWLYGTYITKHFLNYLSSKEAAGVLPPSSSELILSSVTRPELPKV
ncbi:hypothetical protein [Gilliamella sp. Pas-s25]|uniref:hypothetical protein n=1 Tax=Gilliamella sp. Pas-s25 TaxID=2687310 RepID=UPI00135D602D|nr:hypothetical protein [Gilliamella sp. Pas-s25]MWP62026.1 hypothetical protein [Gilliamella sp. Pas-s25]